MNKYYILLIFLLVLNACSEKETELERPNIVWITSEDNSKHYLKLFDANGVETPNIERLAAEGIIFRHAFSNAPVCSVARSTLISGCYAPRIGAQFHRKIQMVPMPDSLLMFPAYLRRAGYYTTNNSKEDYNLIKSDGVWDESSKNASYKHRKPGQPFFHVFNIGVCHESSLHFSESDMQQKITKTPLDAFTMQPNHPQTDLFRYTNAYYRDKIQEMDTKVGEVVADLAKDGLLEQTIIFYYGDHGGVLPGSKGYLFETGLHVPLVVYVPEKYRKQLQVEAGTDQNGFVSFVDFAPTVLALAGINIPTQMDGKPFLGNHIDPQEVAQRNSTFSYADRFDEKYDQVRAVRKGRYKYIRYFQPFIFDGLMNNYRYLQLAYQEWASLFQENKLNEIQSAFFRPHGAEALYDVEADPFETKNLVMEKSAELQELRMTLDNWIVGMPDLSLYPEHYLIDNAFKNPVAFGRQHRKDIKDYLMIANLGLEDLSSVSEALTKYLQSEDPWQRYWAIIACTNFAGTANTFQTKITDISQADPELINRVRAAEYLAIANFQNPVKVLTEALYASEEPAEALLILNEITLMASSTYGYDFNLNIQELDAGVKNDAEVKRRLIFLNGS
ncbi:MAG: sulfatase [Saprospiraceae bacterium]|nr:sulfatase [Saprospiraceae bacterium]